MKKSIIFCGILFPLLFAGIFLFVLKVNANTDVSGIISEDTTWTLANSPYVINEDLQIAQNATLTIEEGVIIRVNSGKKIRVAGNLNTNGSESLPVKFTSTGSSKWWGIEFIDTNNSNINNTIIENATRAIDLKGISLVNFIGNIFRHNDWVVTDTNGYQNMQFLNNTFLNNDEVFYGIRTLGDGNRFENNIFIDNNKVFGHGYYFGQTAITNNNFLDNNFVIEASESGYGYGTVDISNNWWGTTDTSIIDGYIEDGNDDVSLQTLNYNPIKNFEISNIGSSIIIDTTPPVIALIDSSIVNLYVGDTYEDQGATAEDDVDGDITDSIVVGGDTVDTNTPGTYIITYNVSDAAGNPADQVTRTVIVSEVSDTTAPADITNFTAVAGDTQVALSWTNPTDADFVGIKILRGYVTGVVDGIQIYDGIGTSYTDTGLINGTTYYYKAITYDEVPNYSSGVEVSAMPGIYIWSARAHHTSLVFNNKMWILGGYDGLARNDVWYSTDGANWTMATSSAPWPARYYHGSLVFDNKMWVMGGNDSSAHVSLHDVWYSTDGVNWLQATPSADWPAKSNFTLVVFDNKMWILGGMNQYGSGTNDVWYSSDGVNWTQATDQAAWPSRLGCKGIVFDNRMWVMGQSDGHGTILNDVWYSADGINWTEATSSADWPGRTGHSLLVFDGKMWVMGGQVDSGKANDVWYSADGINWNVAALGVAWQARNYFTSLVFDNKMWVMGGYGIGDIWYSTDGVNWAKPESIPLPDTTAPVITLLGEDPVNLYVGDSYTDAGATALDDVDGDITADIIVGGDTVDTSTADTYVITYNVSDAAGNPATEVTRTVIVGEAPNTTPLVPYQVINLEPGWNVVSSPKVISSYEFSVPENTHYLDIYLLDPKSPSGWKTLQGVGQTKFEPLYAYFIYNKTDTIQTLRLNYDNSLTPAQRLFQRTLEAGWNAVGVVAPDYALSKGTGNVDTDNVSKILSPIINSVGLVIDFTAGQPDLDSVKIGNTWAAKVASEVDDLNDFRELKGYGVFITERTDDYHGSQNINDGFKFSVADNNPAEVYPDVNDQALFIFQANSLYYDVSINSLTFSYNIIDSATSNGNSIINFRLYDDDTGELLASTPNISGNNIEFSNLEINCTSGEIKKIKLVGDVSSSIVGRETHEFSLKNTVLSHEVPITGLPISNLLTIISPGTLQIIKRSDSPTGNIAKDATNKLVAKFDVKAVGEKIKITTLTITTTMTNNVNNAVGLDKGKLVVDGIQIGNTTDLNTSSSGADTVFNLGAQFIVDAGQTKVLEIYADVKAADGTSIASPDATIQTDLKVGSGVATGNQLTVTRAILSSVRNVSVANMTVIDKSLDVLLGSWLITAGSAEGVDVASIAVTDRDAADGANGASALGSAFQNLTLWTGGTQYGQTITSPTTTAGGSNTFSLPTNLRITAGQSVRVDLRGDVLGTASSNWTDTDCAKISSISGVGLVTTSTITDSTGAIGQQITSSGAGTLTMTGAATPTMPDNQLAVFGDTGVVLGAWDFAADNTEDLEVTRVEVREFQQDGPGNVQNLKLFVAGSQVPTASPITVDSLNTSTSSTYPYPYAVFSKTDGDGLFTIPKGDEVTVTLKGSITGFDNALAGTNGKNLRFKIVQPATIAAISSISARGAASGTFATSSLATADSNITKVVRTKPTFAVVSPSSTVLVNTTIEVIRFKIDADDAFKVDFDGSNHNIRFTISSSTSSLNTPRAFNLYYAGDNQTIATQISTTPNTGVTVSFTDIDTTIDKGGSNEYYVKANLQDFGSSGGNAFQLYIGNAAEDLSYGDGVSSADINQANYQGLGLPMEGPLLSNEIP